MNSLFIQLKLSIVTHEQTDIFVFSTPLETISTNSTIIQPTNNFYIEFLFYFQRYLQVDSHVSNSIPFNNNRSKKLVELDTWEEGANREQKGWKRRAEWVETRLRAIRIVRLVSGDRGIAVFLDPSLLVVGQREKERRRGDREERSL